MKTSERPQIYEYEEKLKWRIHVQDQITARSFNFLDGRLQGKWLEPINEDAMCFTQLLERNIIDEENLIGLDLDPKNRARSNKNVAYCRKIFTTARFYAKSWSSFCYSNSGKGLQVIIYDLFTSTHGVEFQTNLNATCSLIEKALKFSDQVLLVVNADLGVMHRQQKSLSDFKNVISSTVKVHAVPKPSIDTKSMYTYRNSEQSTLMGSLLLDFH